MACSIYWPSLSIDSSPISRTHTGHTGNPSCLPQLQGRQQADRARRRLACRTFLALKHNRPAAANARKTSFIHKHAFDVHSLTTSKRSRNSYTFVFTVEGAN